MGNYFSKEEDIKYTPLHHCVICDNVDAAGSLRWKGYTVHDKDSRGETVNPIFVERTVKSYNTLDNASRL